MLKLVAAVEEIDVGEKVVDDEMVGDDVVKTKLGFGNTVNEILRTDDVLGVVEKGVNDELRSGVKKSVDGELRSGDEPSCLEKSVINNEPTSENETCGEKRVHVSSPFMKEKAKIERKKKKEKERRRRLRRRRKRRRKKRMRKTQRRGLSGWVFRYTCCKFLGTIVRIRCVLRFGF